jgi:hypothetical protein
MLVCIMRQMTVICYKQGGPTVWVDGRRGRVSGTDKPQLAAVGWAPLRYCRRELADRRLVRHDRSIGVRRGRSSECLNVAQTRRRWFQIRITGLLALVAVLAIALGWFRYQLNGKEALIARICTGGGSIETEARFPDWLKRLAGRSSVESLERVVGVTITGAQLGTISAEDLQRFRHLERVSLIDVRIGPTPDGTVIYTDEMNFNVDDWRRVQGILQREAALGKVD